MVASSGAIRDRPEAAQADPLDGDTQQSAADQHQQHGHHQRRVQQVAQVQPT